GTAAHDAARLARHRLLERHQAPRLILCGRHARRVGCDERADHGAVCTRSSPARTAWRRAKAVAPATWRRDPGVRSQYARLRSRWPANGVPALSPAHAAAPIMAGT